MSNIRLTAPISVAILLAAGPLAAQQPGTVVFDARSSTPAPLLTPDQRQSPQGEILYDTLWITDRPTADAGVGNAIGGARAFPSLGTIDSQFADDFHLDSAHHITTLFADYQSFFNGDFPDEGIWVQFYADEGGQPSNTLHADIVVNSFNTEFKGVFANYETYRYEIDISAANIVLEAGDWWVDIQPLDIADGGWFWALSQLNVDPPEGNRPHVRDGWQAHGNNYYGLWRTTTWIPHNFRGNATPARQIRGMPATGRPRLQVAGACPGTMRLTFTGGTPRSRIGILIAGETGSFTIPGGPCRGTVLGLGSRGLQVVATPLTDGDGRFELARNVGTAVCGRYLQAVDGPTCVTTNVVRIE